MIPRLSPARRAPVVALGSSLTVSWASSYYIPAVLAVPMAKDLGLSPVWVFGAFSMAMVVSAMVGPWAGARIDGFGGRGVLMLSNLVFASGLFLLALSDSPAMLFAGWAIIGLGMGIGLYEAGFATLAGIYGKEARGPITGITLRGQGVPIMFELFPIDSRGRPCRCKRSTVPNGVLQRLWPMCGT